VNISTNQRRWIDIQRLMMRHKLVKKWYPPANSFRLILSKISLSKNFEVMIMFCIIVNVVVLAMPYLGMSERYEEALYDAGYFFSIVYNLEAVIKIGGLGVYFFDSPWNLFDIFIVVSSNIGMIIETFFSELQLTNLIVVIRALRIMRVVKLAKGNQNIKVMINTLLIIASILINIAGLMGLCLFIFAILGMNIFHGVMLQEHYNEISNFQSLTSSLLLLIRCMTGEKWHLIMKELNLQGEYNGV